MIKVRVDFSEIILIFSDQFLIKIILVDYDVEKNWHD